MIESVIDCIDSNAFKAEARFKLNIPFCFMVDLQVQKTLDID